MKLFKMNIKERGVLKNKENGETKTISNTFSHEEKAASIEQAEKKTKRKRKQSYSKKDIVQVIALSIKAKDFNIEKLDDEQEN